MLTPSNESSIIFYMEIIVALSVGVIAFLFYKINMLSKQLSVLSFTEACTRKLLLKKELIKASEHETIINEIIGDMDPDVGDKIIENAKDIGIIIPKYMGEDELKEYIEKQEFNRVRGHLSYTDQRMLEEN